MVKNILDHSIPLDPLDHLHSAGTPPAGSTSIHLQLLLSHPETPSSEDVTISKPPIRLVLLHLLHLAYPYFPLRRLPIHLSSIYIIEISINTLTSFYSMVYPMV